MPMTSPSGVTEAAVEAAIAAGEVAFEAIADDPAIAKYGVPSVFHPTVFRAAILAAIPLLSPSMGWEIKKLEWRQEPIPPSSECLASSAVGLYCIPLGRQAFPLRFRDKENFGEFDTLDTAKAAAQADYEARIRSALLPPANGEGR